MILRAGKHGKEPYRYENITPPKAVDWTTKGTVGPVKNQHVNGSACGCCWTFATTGVVECIVAMATGKRISLSEQQLIDCDRAGVLSFCGCFRYHRPLPLSNQQFVQCGCAAETSFSQCQGWWSRLLDFLS